MIIEYKLLMMYYFTMSNSKINLSDFKKIYIKTSKEYVEGLWQSSLLLEKNPSDKNALSQLHICSHSLSGQSHVMGHNHIGYLAGSIEIVSRSVLDKKSKLTPRLLAIIKKAINTLNLSVKSIEEDHNEKNSDNIAKELAEVSGGK